MFDVVEELPMFAFTLHSDATPMHMGSKVEVVNVGGNDHAPARHFIANGFRRQALALRDVFHLLGDTPLTGVIHLCADTVGGTRCNPLVSHTALDYTRFSLTRRSDSPDRKF